MRLIKDIYADKEALGKPTISFEFFPFKTPEGEVRFFDKTLPALMEARPDYASVTYGAGGSTREKTLDIVEKIQGDFGLTTMAHLTCVKHTIDEINSILDDAKNRGIRNILALRGDPPPGENWAMTDGGFEYASDLVSREKLSGKGGQKGFPIGGKPFCLTKSTRPRWISFQYSGEKEWPFIKIRIDMPKRMFVSRASQVHLFVACVSGAPRL